MDRSFRGRSSGEYYQSGHGDYGNHGRGGSGSAHRPSQGEGERDTYQTAANLLATIMTMIEKDGPDTDQGAGYARERSPQSGYSYREPYNSAPSGGSRPSVGYSEPFSRPRGLAGSPDHYDYDEPPRGQQHGPQDYGGGYDDYWGGGHAFAEPGLTSNKHGYKGHAEQDTYEAPTNTRGFRGRGHSSRNFRGQGGRPGFGSREGRQATGRGGVPYVPGFRGHSVRPGQRGRPFDKSSRDFLDRKSYGRGGTPAWSGAPAGSHRGKHVVPLMKVTTAQKKDGGDGSSGAGGAPSTSQKPQTPTDSAGAGSGSKPRTMDKLAATIKETGAVKRKLPAPPASSGKKARNEELGSTSESETKKSKPVSQSSTSPQCSTAVQLSGPGPHYNKLQHSCSLCRFRTLDGSEMELHMQSKLHRESLRHLQEIYPNDPSIVNIIDEFLKIRSQKNKEYTEMQNSNVGTTTPSKAMGDKVILDDSMESMEVVQCHACSIKMVNVAWVVKHHMDSAAHKAKRETFNSTRKNSVRIIFKSIMNNRYNFEILKELKEKFQKETSPVASSSSTLKEINKKASTADDKITHDKATVDKKTTLEKITSVKTAVKTSAKKPSATQAQTPKVTLSKPKAKVVPTQKVAVKKDNSLTIETTKEKVQTTDINLKTGDSKQSPVSLGKSIQVEREKSINKAFGDDICKMEEEVAINNEEFELENAEVGSQVAEPENVKNDEILKEAEEEWFLDDEGLLDNAKKSNFMQQQDEAQFLKICEEEEAPQEVDRESLDDETYLEVDTLADDHDTPFSEIQGTDDYEKVKESKNEANNDDAMMVMECYEEAAPAVRMVAAEMSDNCSEKPFPCPPLAADVTMTTAPSACADSPRDMLPPPMSQAKAGKLAKGATRVAGETAKAGVAAKITPKPPAGNPVKSGPVKAQGPVEAVKVVATKRLPATKTKTVKNPVVKTVEVVEESILLLKGTSGETPEAASGMLKVVLTPVSQPATACDKEASAAAGSEMPVGVEESEENKGGMAIALPKVVVLEAVNHPQRRGAAALTATVRGRGTRGRSKRGKRKVV